MKHKKRVSLYMTDLMHEKLKSQAKILGLDMGAYVVHLIMLKQEERRYEKKME